MHTQDDRIENTFHKYFTEPQLADQSQRFFDIMITINDAHTLMLMEQGILSREEAKQLLNISNELSRNGVKSLDLVPEKEDLYLNMEAHIIKRLGDYVGGKLHIGRSRNDLYAAMQRMKCREELLKISDLLIQLRKVLLDTAEDNANTIIPGYTHMQPAQPITYGHYLSAHASALERDFDRLAAAYRRTNLNPMGAGALAGTGFNINRNLTGNYLAFDADLANTLDAVASRDYAAEMVSAMTILLSTVGRMNQDFYFWITSEFSLIDLPDEFLFSSSIMPQKRNPILFEHSTAKVSHVLGIFVSIITTMKGLPYTHTRSTGGEVFTLLWKAFHETEITLRWMVLILGKIEIRKDNALMNAKRNFSTVTELADDIVRKMGVSFRTAHEIVRKEVLRIYKQGKTSEDITMDGLNNACLEVLGEPLHGIDANTIAAALDPLENVKRRTVTGGPAPSEVLNNIENMRKQFEMDASEIDSWKQRITSTDELRHKKIAEVINAS